jgi:hypothetical protein
MSYLGLLVVVGSLSSLLPAAAAAAAITQEGASSSANFRVRNVQGRLDELNDRQRELMTLELTFSQEGDPVDLPPFQLQIFPTPNPLTSESEITMKAALEDYLKVYFDGIYPELDTRPEESSPQFHSISVDLANMNSITSDNTRRNLQRKGTQFDIQTVLRFQDGVFPEYEELSGNMKDAMSNNFDDFLVNYLAFYATPELASIDSGNYVSGFTGPPTTAPTVAPTTAGGLRNNISQINQGVTGNSDKGDGVNPLWPAVGCGVAMFVLTALFFSYRVKRLSDWDAGTDADDIEHISVDFDGRQEALELERERRYQQQKEQEMLHEQQEREMLQQQQQKEAATPSKRKWGGWGKSQEPVERVRMEDGRTTIHIAPVLSADEDHDTRLAETPMILNTASTMRDQSFHDEGKDLYRTYTSDSEYTDSEAASGWGGTSQLPSMSRGDAEFGRHEPDLRRGYV